MDNETLNSLKEAKEAMFNALGNAGILSFDYDEGAKKFEEYYHTGDFNEVGTFNRMVAEVLKAGDNGFCMVERVEAAGKTAIVLGVPEEWWALLVIE